jgi:hypothetical protein
VKYYDDDDADDDDSPGVKRPGYENDISHQLMPRSRICTDTPVHSLHGVYWDNLPYL